METAKTEVDLKWKMNKFIDNGDVSFLGKSIGILNQRISLAESKDIVDSTNCIVSINRSQCETAQKLKITKNKFNPDA